MFLKNFTCRYSLTNWERISKKRKQRNKSFNKNIIVFRWNNFIWANSRGETKLYFFLLVVIKLFIKKTNTYNLDEFLVSLFSCFLNPPPRCFKNEIIFSKYFDWMLKWILCLLIIFLTTSFRVESITRNCGLLLLSCIQVNYLQPPLSSLSFPLSLPLPLPIMKIKWWNITFICLVRGWTMESPTSTPSLKIYRLIFIIFLHLRAHSKASASHLKNKRIKGWKINIKCIYIILFRYMNNSFLMQKKTQMNDLDFSALLYRIVHWFNKNEESPILLKICSLLRAWNFFFFFYESLFWMFCYLMSVA